jgi:hypothetical protein
MLHANGGGVGLTDGTFTMNGGSIDDNDTRWGGGVYTDSGAFTMNGGSIRNNKARNTYDATGGGIFVGTAGNFVMNGGTISGNTATLKGGGIICGDNFVMNGGTISGNTAPQGGGIYWGNFTMSGNAQINIDNTVYLEPGQVIFVHGPLSAASAAAIDPATTASGTVLVRGTSDSAYTGSLPGYGYVLTAADAGKFTYSASPLNYDNTVPAAPVGKIP